MCRCNELINVEVIRHSKHAKLERNGDLIDLSYCGLNKDFSRIVYDGIEFSKVSPSDNGAIEYKKDAIFRVSLGVSMKLPKGKMAKVVARSGTRKNFNVMLTNAVGQIDNKYQGTNDIWLAEFVALDDGKMELGDRVLQFEITDIMPEVNFIDVDELSSEDRGGFSSTGTK